MKKKSFHQEYEITLPKLQENVVTRYRSFLKKIDTADSALIFSAHFDDAILSMGATIGYLLAKGKKVHIVTIFTKGSEGHSQQTEGLLTQAGFTNVHEYFSARENENKISIDSLGSCASSNLNFIDAPWRLKIDGTLQYPQKVIGVENIDKQLEQEIIQVLHKFIVSDSTLIFTHLGWGRHIDHVITRDTSMAVFPGAIFFRDFPYSTKYPQVDPFIAEYNLDFIDWNEPYYKQKAQAILLYTTQLKSLFKVNPMILPLERFYFRTL